jgi:hypothetical protein
MRVTPTEFALVALTIGYIAFYTNPPPKIIQDFISSPVGKVISLSLIGLILVYKSLILGIFLAIAGIITIGNITEYLDPKEQTPKEPEQPKSSGVAPPEVHGALKSLLSGTKPSAAKGDRMPSVAQKKGTPPIHSTPPAAPPKPSAPKTVETFAGVYN